MNDAYRHPAREIPFDDLLAGLEAARAQRAVYARGDGNGLLLWCYTPRCVYDSLWSESAIIARGLIVDPARKRVLATPFPKFFNLGEQGDDFPERPFEVFEKLDGSLIILFHDGDRWRTATKGAFDSSQAAWAAEHLSRLDLSALDKGTTYLTEAIYPENRIVIPYDETGLVLLAAYDADGYELSHADIGDVAARLSWRAAARYAFASQTDLMLRAAELPRTEEGFVVRFDDGLRLKIKGAEYRRIHALISRVTPLAVWEAMDAGDDLSAMRRDLPEEFWGDFDQIRGLIEARLERRIAEARAATAATAHLTDKEIGLGGGNLDPSLKPLVFACRRFGESFPDGRTLAQLMRSVRPTDNVLPGYEPSYAMARLIEEAV